MPVAFVSSHALSLGRGNRFLLAGWDDYTAHAEHQQQAEGDRRGGFGDGDDADVVQEDVVRGGGVCGEGQAGKGRSRLHGIRVERIDGSATLR